MDAAEPSTDLAARLADELATLGGAPLLVVTGAGISLASGIPTFRGTDPGALWKRDVTELATRRYFEADPVGSWTWYLQRFECLIGARSNPAHEALVHLESAHEARGGRFLLVTQNIDTLHEEAGSRSLVKVHGSADRVRCSRDGCAHGAPAGSLSRQGIDLDSFRDEPLAARLPRCPECGAVLRQHVLWFDELYSEHVDYGWDRVVEAAGNAALVLFIGTSFAVGVTDMVLRSALARGARVVALDPNLPSHLPRAVGRLSGRAEEVLPKAVAPADPARGAVRPAIRGPRRRSRGPSPPARRPAPPRLRRRPAAGPASAVDRGR